MFRPKRLESYVIEMVGATKKIAEELGKMNGAETPKERRFKDLLNNVINHFSAGESNHELINKLLDLGFEEEELVNEFNFSRSDIKDVLDDW